MTNPGEHDLREITRADVYINDDLAGHLTREQGDNVSFDYIDNGHSTESPVRERSVSWSLLRSREYPVVTTGGAVPAFFAGLLPEGVRLGVVTSSTKTSADDHLTLLLAIGADTIGNIRIFPTGVAPVRPLPLFEPERDTDFQAVFAKMAARRGRPRGFGGVQPKVSAGMLSTPAQTRSGPAILKLNPVRYPNLVENEHFFMKMAAACGLRTATTSLLHDAHGRTALLVNRFDRVGPKRIAQEDACQIANVYPASKYRIKTEEAITELAAACARGGGSKVTAVAELLKVVIFSWTIGNGDLHGKNLSIYNPDGIWQPTPAYDLLCTQPYAGWKDPMALNLYGRANRLTRTNFLTRVNDSACGRAPRQT